MGTITVTNMGFNEIPPNPARYTWTNKPSAATYGRGIAFFTDLNASGISNGDAWTVLQPVPLLQKATGWLIPSLAAANAATYSQTETTITVTSTAHGITATIYNGVPIYLAIASGLATAGWYTNFTYVDANSFTCTSSISQSTSGVVNTNTASTTITDLTVNVPGTLMGLNGQLEDHTLISCSGSANNKRIQTFLGGQVFKNSITVGATMVAQEERHTLQNRNSLTAQVHLNAFAIGDGTATTNPTEYKTIDTSIDKLLTHSVTVAAANEFIFVAYCKVTIFPSS